MDCSTELRSVAASTIAFLWSSARGALLRPVASLFKSAGRPYFRYVAGRASRRGTECVHRLVKPAGLTRIDETQLLAGAQVINLSVEFDPDSRTTTTGSDGGDAGDTFLAGSFYLAPCPSMSG